MNNWISLGLALLILAIVLIIFVRISRKARRGGTGGATITTFGALYDLHNKDRRRAIETIVEMNAGKKLEEQESSDDLE
ncbi:MAG: hypothetical protein JSW58_11770 [Candidatus Latescibacterota bacterium]|nr:MAG: hypothetical protein JSW58_11770 [Candidatus Latescibacterota bacterium]